jgi:hypothetical protein
MPIVSYRKKKLNDKKFLQSALYFEKLPTQKPIKPLLTQKSDFTTKPLFNSRIGFEEDNSTGGHCIADVVCPSCSLSIFRKQPR